MDGHRDVVAGKQRISPPVAAAATTAQQEFLFVDAAKAKSSRQGRRNARSFVMQKARRERPWSTSKHAKQRKSPETPSPATLDTPDLSHTPITSTPSPPIPHTGAEYFPFVDPNHFPVVKQEICSDCQNSRCAPGQNLCPDCLQFHHTVHMEDIDNGSFDPFGTSSVVMNRRVSELLEHFINEMAPGTIALDIRNKSDLMRSHWFSTATSNSGFMHSLLCTAALHQFFSGKGSAETILYHRAKAIAAINSAIVNPNPEVGISDANIGAVFNLLTVEESLLSPIFDQERPNDDQPYQRGMHLNGLRRMVQLRGGLSAINSNRILQAFILWHSTAHAIASFEDPYLSTNDLNSAACDPRHPPGYQPNVSQHLLNCCQQAQVTGSLITLLESALILIADLNALFSDKDSPLDPLNIQNYACCLECMLLKWLHDNEHSVRPIEHALCVALVIFTVCTTQALKRRSGMHMLHFSANKKLEKALSYTSRSEWQSCPELLLWILAIGAISAEGSAESEWFVYQASLARSQFGIQSADELLNRLHLCGWVSYKLDEAVRHLWTSIINLRPEPYSDDSVVGPLQAGSPDLTDWQNMDWSTFSPLNDPSISPGESFGVETGGDDPFYDMSAGFVFPHNSPFYVR